MIRVVASTMSALSTDRPRLPHYLAIEEWVARVLPSAEYFFTWRVNPTVIFGRNQDPRVEVDLEYCREHGIEVYRRRSGGGCVYADLDNLMLSYITPSTDVATTFAHYTGVVSDALRQLGLDARSTGRNDIAIAGRKVSGNAFYRLPDRSIVHGTLLYRADLDTMRHAITPSRSKLESKAVKSVDNRVTMLTEHLSGVSLDDVERHLLDSFTDSEYVLTEADMAQVAEIERRYYDLAWTFGRRGILASVRDQMHVRRRIDGVGEMDIDITLDGEAIAAIDMTGDYFILDDIDSCLFDRLRGVRPTADEMLLALADVDTTHVIRGLGTDTLVAMIDEAYTLRQKVRRGQIS